MTPSLFSPISLICSAPVIQSVLMKYVLIYMIYTHCTLLLVLLCHLLESLVELQVFHSAQVLSIYSSSPQKREYTFPYRTLIFLFCSKHCNVQEHHFSGFCCSTHPPHHSPSKSTSISPQGHETITSAVLC